MALKRKFDHNSDDIAPIHSKQLKLVPFPNLPIDNDVAMSEAEPMYPEVHHLRLPSDVSSTSSNASPTASPFDIRPSPFFDNTESVNLDSHNFTPSPIQTTKAVGLLQPSNSFTHHGTGCSQIPKLRIACAPGLQGHRTMWSFCEQCGAISMVDTD
ncbi:hypothetical protein BDN72DRAFT_832201 [Pluteus cervinus]|uniref:Uncharacterized protein n=1 Tax=Pluteus cervinus TaxID=181527 RepID=A0ACD3BB16_9AGAR|nr:hypothetical protein BDN72DRAFT_832201 [Pluteus cervinus]